MTPLRKIAIATLAALAVSTAAVADDPTASRRHTTPIRNAATETQAINMAANDTARINAARRAVSSSFVRKDGAIVYTDTVTGEQWIDSTTIVTKPKMQHQLYLGTSVGVNIWDPIMRVFGQKHGLIGFAADVNLHNRYFPTVEAGLGIAHNTSETDGYTYRAPLSPYFKIGIDYNFLFNSNPDYQWLVGLRYGFSPFSWAVDNITMSGTYWDDAVDFSIPTQHAAAGWMEFNIGLRVKLFGNISAGWQIKFHSMLHESANEHGKPWYVPGYGTRGQSINGSFSIFYTLPAHEKPVVTDTIV